MIENLEGEIWKDVVGYEGLYQVSNKGRVKSLHIQEKVLCNLDSGYYNTINLFKDGKGKHYYVHRLVAQAFIPNPNNYPQINHKDENHYNNNVENLEWCTSKYNCNYGTRNIRFSEKLKGRHDNDDTRLKKSLSHVGEKNYMFGKSHTIEAIKKMKENKRGFKWYNNGVVNTQCKECPEGFVEGKITSKSESCKKREFRKSGKWFTDGTVNRFCKECPDGFRPGLTRHSK